MITAHEQAEMYRGRAVCVTGGAGFIGSHIARALVACDAQVRIIDDFSNGLEANLAEIADRISLIRGSILDADALHEAVDGVEVIFHEAAITSVPRSVEDPVECYEVNVTGTMRVLEAARHNLPNHPCRVIYAASSSAYGDQPESPKIETMCPAPLSPYAASKIAGEAMMLAHTSSFSLPTLSLRYFNIFGPGQRADSPYAAVIPIFAEQMCNGRKPTIFGDGEQTRDFTHVANVIHANLLAGAAPQEKLTGVPVNIACGTSYSLLLLVDRMAKALGADPAVEFAPPRVGDVKHSRADITLARELLGYEPIMGFDEGLIDTLDAFRAART